MTTAVHNFPRVTAIQETPMHHRHFLASSAQADTSNINLTSNGVLVLSAPWQMS